MNASSAHIDAADGFAPAVAYDLEVLLTGIRDMLERCKTSNRNDLAVIAIEALIEGGVNTGPKIVGAASGLGFDRKHAGAVLKKTGGQRWQRGDSGVYVVVRN